MLGRILTGLVALGMSGCATISKDTAFDGAQGAFVLVAGDGMGVNGSESFTFAFRRVDLYGGKLLADGFSVQFSGMRALGGDEFAKPDAVKTTLRFGGKPVRHGDYALMSRTDFTTSGSATSTNVHCYSTGAAVFRIAPKTISILSVGHVTDGPRTELDTILKYSAAVLASYPKMTAPQAPAEAVGQITFETKKGVIGGDTCIPEGAITATPFS